MKRPLTILAALLALNAGPAAALSGGFSVLPGFGQAVTPADRHADAFAAGLRDAIASGDGKRVTPYFPAGGPAWTWLGARWNDMRRGTLDPETWEVGFEPYYVRGDAMGGRLTIVAHEAAGRAVAGRFDVEAWKRGRAWVVGDSLPLERPDARIERHDLRLDLRRAGRVLAEDLLTLAPSGPDRRLFLRLDAALRVTGVVHAGRSLPHRQRGEVVYLELPASAQPFTVAITYEGAPPVAAPDHVRDDGALLRAEWPWYPRAFGDPGFAVFRVMAMVPPGRMAIATGDFVGVDRYQDGWIHHWTTPGPVAGTAIVAGPLARAEATAGGVRLETWVRPGHEAASAGFLAEGARALAFYGTRYGAYPHRKLALVDAGLEVGYSAGGALALPAGAFEHAEMADAVLAREIARTWTERVAYRGTPGERAFMTEGVAAYLDMLYHGDRDGLPAYRSLLGEAQKRYGALAGQAGDVALAKAQAGDVASAQAQAGDPSSAAVALDPGERWQRLAWDKSAVVLNMLRRRVGAAAFDKALRDLYQHRAGQTIGLAEFRAAFERASGQHHGAFFDQWLGRPGRPEITPEEVSVRALKGGKYEITGRLVQTGPAWHVMVPLVVKAASGPRLYDIEARAAATPFTLTVPSRPEALLVDPLRDTLVAPIADIPLTP